MALMLSRILTVVFTVISWVLHIFHDTIWEKVETIDVFINLIIGLLLQIRVKGGRCFSANQLVSNGLKASNLSQMFLFYCWAVSSRFKILVDTFLSSTHKHVIRLATNIKTFHNTQKIINIWILTCKTFSICCETASNSVRLFKLWRRAESPAHTSSL